MIARREEWTLLCIVVFAKSFLSGGAGPSSSNHIVREFSDEVGTEQFNHLAIDNVTGDLYIGAVNRIYHLNADLELRTTGVTGPKEDSPDCSSPYNANCLPSAVRQSTDNVNKVLLIDKSRNRLVECGSVSQGTCRLRPLDNVALEHQATNEVVVANNATASTVAFLAPGPAPEEPLVMYIGVTYTGNDAYRSNVPAVASRSLNEENLFKVIRISVTTATRMLLNSYSRGRYPIRYVYGFSSQGFSYFLTNQLRDDHANSDLISKLVRVCQKDWDYYSYTEIPLQCSGRNGTSYNLVRAAYLGRPSLSLARILNVQVDSDVLYALFATNRSGDDDLFRAGRRSALCVYSLKAVRAKFTENIRQCYAGRGQRGLPFISPSMKCTETKIQINDSFCGMEVNTPFGGEIPVHSVAVLEWNALLTSIAVTSISQYNVAFLGTDDGYLKKVVIESNDAGQEYANLLIDEGSPVNADMLFDLPQKHIYVMTTKKISKVKVEDCSIHKTCSSCLGTLDPYCGWCSLQNRCTLLEVCHNTLEDPLSWVSYKTQRCPNITSIKPESLQYTTARTLEMGVDNLPNKLSGQFQCIFSNPGASSLTTDARRFESSPSSSSISCPTPRTDLLPAMQPGQHHFTTVLSIRIKDGNDLVATNFTFFDCNTYASCTQCVNSPFPCIWCVEDHRCNHGTTENCRNELYINGINNDRPSLRSGPLFCPRIEQQRREDSNELLVAAGSHRNISVHVDSIGNIKFNIEGRVRQVKALLLESDIYCQEVEFSYSSPAPNVTASFAVIWDGSKPLDNPHNIHIVVYRCQQMADSCGLCLALPAKYGCGWCQSSSLCKVKEQCEQGMWLNQSQICPNPEIIGFEPKSGPWEGGTNVTIYGINLGKTFQDIYGGILVAAISCSPFEETYVQTQQVTCKLNSPGEPISRKGPVVVKIGDYRGESRESFTFVNPILESVHPAFGPQSGGTKVTIRGRFMDAGNFVSASIHTQKFNDHLPCEIVSRSRSEAQCITSASPHLDLGKLHMQFDNGPRSLNRTLFEYKVDPVISELESGPAGQPRVPKGIPAGGIKIAVTGFHFLTVQDPRIYVQYHNRTFENPCQVIDDSRMTCLSPAIDVHPDEFLDADNPPSLDYGFLLDAVPSVRNLKSKGGMLGFLLYPNPVFDVFDNIKHYKSDYLTINGHNLDRATQESDVTVRIGTQFCNVTSLSRSQLTCRPPAKQPPASAAGGKENYNHLPEVQVIVGGNLTYHIGKLSYNNPGIAESLLPRSAIIGVIASGAVLILMVIFILIAYKRKSKESSRVVKNMKEQMDVLELRVAAECKEAFAELQTEMTDLTGDLTSDGIPYLDYRSYTIKILFPNIENHPVLQPEWHETSLHEKGLCCFNQLLLNKTFLLIFIRTLEGNRYFCMRDRVNVASLIMVALQGRLEYCTDILKTLLSELIERYNDGRNHPKLLLRRTEYVAEKMLSAWFAFMLHNFVRGCAGEPLYVLYRAIKQQVEKGPVDAVTGEARYSLSEEKLVRQSVSFERLTIYVSMSKQTLCASRVEPQSEAVDSPVRVLDCDTISQVKEKALDVIYRSTPFSQRPSIEELDLEWRRNAYDRLVLYDEDNTSKVEDGMRRLNTLSHYSVPDNASFTLMPKSHLQQTPAPFAFALDRTLDRTPRYESLTFRSGTPPQSRTISPVHTDNCSLLTWHLVRHHDQDGQQRNGERGKKMMSEIYLTRLLTTKLPLQKFVDDLFETIFSTTHRVSALPLAIKYMFDFLDDQALQHGITDYEIVHTWKSNALPLRFWVNLIKNPNFVFDIHKSNIVDACLSVIAQTFMDSCSTSDHRLGKDSPSCKLLYAKDIPKYREWVERYYRDISAMPSISDQDMNAMLAEESRAHANDFNSSAAILELYKYACRYNEQIQLALDEDEFARVKKLPTKLELVHSYMGAPVV